MNGIFFPRKRIGVKRLKRRGEGEVDLSWALLRSLSLNPRFSSSLLRSDGGGGLPERNGEKKKFRRIQTAIREKMACDPGMEGKIFLPSGVFFLLLASAANEGVGGNRAVQEDAAMDAAGIKKEGGGNMKFVRRSSDWGAPMDGISPSSG